MPARPSAASIAAGWCSSTALSSPELSDLTPEPGLTIGSMAEALAKGDPRVAAHVGKTFPNDDVAVALNTALMGDGAVIHVAAGTALARPIHLVFARQREAERRFHPLAGGGREGRQGDHHREPRGRCDAGQRGARAGGRRRHAGRPLQADASARAARRQPDGFDRRARRRSIPSPSPAMPRWCATRASSVLPARAAMAAFAASACCAARSTSTTRC